MQTLLRKYSTSLLTFVIYAAIVLFSIAVSLDLV